MRKIPQTWRLAWGKVDQLRDPTWRDRHLAVYLTQPEQMAISPSGQFVLIGDVWLSDRAELLALITSTPRSEPRSDLELVAIAWETWGVATLSKLVGSFGLVVWDHEREELCLGRDRSGAKTLYYTINDSGNNPENSSGHRTTRWIAPNLRSLQPYHSRELDLVALRDYLCCAFVPGAQTLWRQVRELRQGTVLHLPDERIHAYWELKESITESDRSLSWHGEQLRILLDRVVQEYLPKQEPVGVFLSGGLDSSCITALAAKFHSAPVHTYSIHFGNKCPNELEFSSLVAKHCHTEHHILEITFRQMWEQLPETMARLDDPIGDPLTVPNLLLSRLAKKSVGIVLNGEGGDPCFGGPKNQPMLINQLYGIESDQNSLQAYLLSFQKCAADLGQLLKPEIFAAVQDQPSVFSDDLTANVDYLNRLMMLNIKFKGADQILTKVNNLTQASGLAGRSPLFDQRVVAMSMQIPPTYKLSGVEEKAVLKQAVMNLLPQEILHRPKSGMMVPVQMGFKEHWNRQAKALLLSRRAAIAPYLNQSVIKEWLGYRGDTWQRYGVKLWLLASLEYWLQEN
jgi:asparagine synthase (glutamine-hydrolysing)